MKKWRVVSNALNNATALFTTGPARADRLWEAVSPAPVAVVRTTLYRVRQQSQKSTHTQKSGYFQEGQRVSKLNVPLRCFLWVVLRLGNGWNGERKFTSPVVGGGSEVDEAFESPSHSLC